MKKYEEIYLDLEEQITSKHFSVGDKLPSENQLALLYDVSRETIRNALNMLLNNGYIIKKQGLGSIVLNNNRYTIPTNGLISHKELNEDYGWLHTTKVIKNEIIPTPSFLRAKEDIKDDEEFIHLIRSRNKEGKAIIIDEDYIRRSIVQEISNKHAKNSIYQYFEEDLGLQIGYAQKEFRGQRARQLDQEILGIKETDTVIVVSSMVYLSNAQFFQYTISRHHMDHFQFREFAARKNRIAKKPK